ncbi:MAG: AraC family transcriptional regulator [Bacteroidaceae bacterium]|nr:AraC family transcriptional regulator [Bacteroidaceae bacterium]
MSKESIRLVNLESFKEFPQSVIYFDGNIAILGNIEHFTLKNEKEVRLDCLMLCFCEEGEVSFNINHRRYILKKDFCAILPPGTIVGSGGDSFRSIKIAAVSKGFFEEIICFNKETLSIMHYLYNNPIQPTGQATSYKMYLYKELFLTLIKEKVHAYSKQTRHFHFAGMICEMLARVSKKIPANIKVATKRERAAIIVHDFMVAVNTDDGSHRSVNYYADRLCYSAKYISYSVKQATGKTPLEIINAHAINQIKHKLKYTNMSMKNMADYFNFPNPSFFGKFVKKHTGLSPMQYKLSQNDDKE